MSIPTNPTAFATGLYQGLPLPTPLVLATTGENALGQASLAKIKESVAHLSPQELTAWANSRMTRG